jgi:hypothetical protein
MKDERCPPECGQETARRFWGNCAGATDRELSVNVTEAVEQPGLEISVPASPGKPEDASALTSPGQPLGPGPLPVINKASGSRARRQGVRFRSFKTKGSMITDVHLYAKEN